MQPISYARHQFPPEVIRHAVWLYLRFTLSYRDVEELLAERGVDVKVIDTVAVGDSVAHVAISPDGTKALAIKPLANKVAVLRIEGEKVSYDKYDVVAGVFPYNVDITPGGQIALIANNGAG